MANNNGAFSECPDATGLRTLVISAMAGVLGYYSNELAILPCAHVLWYEYQ